MLNRYRKAAIVIAISAASLGGLAHAQNKMSSVHTADAATQSTQANPFNPDASTRSRTGWLTIGQVYSKLEAAGYSDIREIEREHDGYEVEARNREGLTVKLQVEPLDGRVVREKVRNKD